MPSVSRAVFSAVSLSTAGGFSTSRRAARLGTGHTAVGGGSASTKCGELPIKPALLCCPPVPCESDPREGGVGRTRALRLRPLCLKSPVRVASLLFSAQSLKENDYSSKC